MRLTPSQTEGPFYPVVKIPVPYSSRPPHIHVKLWRGEQELLTTQLYLKGQTGNEWWGGKARDHLQFEPINIDGRIVGTFDFVIA